MDFKKKLENIPSFNLKMPAVVHLCGLDGILDGSYVAAAHGSMGSCLNQAVTAYILDPKGQGPITLKQTAH